MRYPFIGLILIVVIIVLVDYWLYQRMKRRINPIKKPHIYWFFVVFVPSLFIASFTALYFLVHSAKSPTVYEWFGYCLVLFLSLYLGKLIWLIWHVSLGLIARFKQSKPVVDNLSSNENKVPYPVMSRRKFLSQVGIVIATVPFMGLVFGMMKGRFNFYTRYKKLSFPNLPSAFDGFRIVQLSDSHLGSFHSNFEAIDEVVDIINSHHPDIVVFTGDLVNNFHQETIGWEKVFNKIKAPGGCYSILGNHDYGYYTKWNSEADKIENFNKIIEANERLGFTLLRNQNVTFNRQGQSIAMAGVEYWGTSGHHPNKGNLIHASQDIENIPFKILLTHDPAHWEAEVVEQTNYDLTLSGHTHGMQFGFDYKGYTWSPAQYKFKYWDGLYQKGNQFLFINRGLGTLSIPVRVGMDPEITLIELSRGPIGTEPM